MTVLNTAPRRDKRQRAASSGMNAARWSNWAATARATPSGVACPEDADEAAALIRSAADEHRTVRPLGNGHSFSGVGAPVSGHLALDLSGWSGIVRVEQDTRLVTVRAGTSLRQLNTELREYGLALANLGDIDSQTIAGAISTGTHGTGASFGGLSTQVEALEIVLGDGTVRRCSATENEDLFDAARIGLGALGVLSTVTVRCVPAFALAADERPQPLESVLERFDTLADTNDHFEFYWFPHTRYALVKRNNRVPAGANARPLHPARSFLEYNVLENHAFGALCRIGRQIPSLVRPLTRLCARTWSTRSYSDRSDNVFVTSRKVRFVESEYALPREALREVLEELRAVVRTLEYPVMFPIEVRVAAPDDIWMSTAYQRPTAYVAIHQFIGMPYRHYFDAFESIAGAAGGRPHWGKMHRLDAAQLRTRYPRFDDFLRVRAESDPDRVFRNSYLDRVLVA